MFQGSVLENWQQGGVERRGVLDWRASLPRRVYNEILVQRRDEVNQRLSNKVQRLFKDQSIARRALDCMLPGRKIRSILFVELVKALDPEVKESAINDVVFAIEAVHAASVLVDDVVDNDSIRHGTSSVSHLWGNSTSIVFAHSLVSSALLTLNPYPLVQQRLLGVYSQMAVGEMYDLMLPAGTWIPTCSRS